MVSDGIVLESTATYLRITQSPKRFTDLIGKLATFSLIYDNILYSVSFHLGDNNGSGHTVIGGVRIYSLGTDLPFAIQISGILRTGVISAVKLELGDQQTLAHKDADGNWVLNDPPNYDLQYALCNQYSPITGEFVGSQHSNPNLLDNAYWANKNHIINQRGQTEYTDTGYTIDRWKNSLIDKVEIFEDYISLSVSNTSNTYANWGQLLPFNFKELGLITLSVMYKNSSQTSTIAIYDAKGTWKASTDMPASTVWNIVSLTISDNSPEAIRAQLYPTVAGQALAGTLEIRAMKLELGPVQTLAHKDENGNWVLNDPPPNKALELAKCQRYQRVLSRGTIAQVVNSNSVVIKYPFDQPMRVAPVSVILNPQMKFLSAVEVLPPATNASVLSSDMTDKGVAYIHITGFNWSLPTNTVVALNDDNAVLLDANI